jgi:hypothetical protein
MFFLSRQSGNFLVQAMLALTMVFAFIPFIAQNLASRNTDARMFASTRQIDNVATAARIFIRENANSLPYNQTVLSGVHFSDILEPYGLPLGFVPRTALGQDIALVINKSAFDVSAYLELTGGEMSDIDLAELSRRVGFYATPFEGGIRIGIVLTDDYSDVLRRNESNLDNSAFLADIDMGGFSFNNASNVYVARGEFETTQINTLSIVGTELDRKTRNKISEIVADRTVFQSKDGGAALALTRGTLTVGSLDARTIASFGDAGSLTSNIASVYDFSMTAGRSSFSGPALWDIRGNLVSDNISFSVERLDVSSYINVARGQDVYIETDDLSYSTKSGIETSVIYTSNITMRDQTSEGLASGNSGAVILDIRPAGASLLPDAYVNGVDNASFKILSDPASDESETTDCSKIIKDLEGVYNQRSLAQYIICQYVYWQRIERRIDIKQCIMAGGSDCK